MQIIRAIDLSYVDKFKHILSIKTAEAYFKNRLKWEEGSFNVISVEFSDGSKKLYLDYPTDLDEDQVLKLIKEN